MLGGKWDALLADRVLLDIDEHGYYMSLAAMMGTGLLFRPSYCPISEG